MKGENYFHVKTYEDSLRSVQQDFPSIFDDGDLVWNMDETHVDGEFGKRKHVISPADTHHGGSRTTTAGSGNGRHVTLVIAVSASGKKSPPFYIVEGKRNMSNWYLPLSSENYLFDDGNLKQFAREGWFPSDACVVMQENGSMTKEIIPIFMEHMEKFVRKYVPQARHYCLMLDGHSSRKGLEWLEYAKAHRCEVVQSPANTSHFLQPCDQETNKRFADTIRRVRDKFCIASRGQTDTRSIQSKLMFATAAFDAITMSDIRQSWDATGLWPMDYRFTKRYNRNRDEVIECANNMMENNANSGPAASLKGVRQRKADRETFELLASIVDAARQTGCTRVSTALQNASICLNNHQTVNSILMAKERSIHSATNTRVSGNKGGERQKPKNVALSAGAPAQYLTHADLLEKRREEIRKEEAQRVLKAAASKARADKKKEVRNNGNQ